jgi:hypothetical protein
MENNKSKQKQHLIDMMKLDEEAGLYEETKSNALLMDEAGHWDFPKSTVDKMKPLQEQWQQDMDKELMKKETLEEAGEKLYPNRESFLHRFQNIERKAFTEGAKWQQEQLKDIYLDGYVDGSRAQAKLMYSEEEADEFAIEFAEWLIKRQTNYFESLKELLEIYKKEISNEQ